MKFHRGVAAWAMVVAALLAVRTDGFSATPDALAQAVQLRTEAQRLTNQGRYTAGVSKAREALALSEQNLPGDDPALANSIFTLAELLRLTNRFTEAKTLYERFIKLNESAKGADPVNTANGLLRLGGVLAAMGDLGAAQAKIESAVNILEKRPQPNDIQIAVALANLARVYAAEEKYAEAQSALERVIRIRQNQQRARAKSAGAPPVDRADNSRLTARVVARLTDALGDVQQKMGATKAAQTLFQRALAMREKFLRPNHPDIGESLVRLAALSQASGDTAAAKAYYERAIALLKNSPAAETHRIAAAGLAQILEGENRLSDALRLYREAARLLENLSGQFEDETVRSQYLQAGDKLATYDGLVRVLMKLHQRDPARGYYREAWAVLDAKKGRVVAESMASARPELRDGAARQQMEKANDARDQAIALENDLLEEQAKAAEEQQSGRIQSLTTLLAKTKADYLEQVQSFLARYPQYRTQFIDQQTVDPKALAKFADRLPAGTLAVQYFSGADALYLFAVAPGGKYEVKSQAIKQTELYAMIKDYRQYVQQAANQQLSWNDDGSPLFRRYVQPLKELTRKLSIYLLEPIKAELREHKNVVIIPNDLLLYLPFHALTYAQPDGVTRFLAETHAVSYLTQLELADLVNPSARNPNARLLALANPDGSLPQASREIKEIGKIRSSVMTLDGSQATKERFLQLASEYSDLHLATHGVLDPARPERSYLLMAGPDDARQRLTITEIAGLRLAANGLAILSACETAVGEQVPGAALITLAAAFSQAGSQSILASLWKVEDAATSALMVEFHKELSKLGRVAALQQAEISVLKNPATTHPYYWAPFVLIGAR